MRIVEEWVASHLYLWGINNEAERAKLGILGASCGRKRHQSQKEDRPYKSRVSALRNVHLFGA
jgi:hypothetical protein